MHPGRAVAVAGVLLAGLAILLPLATFPVVGPVDGVDGDAWPALIPLVPVLLLAVVGRRRLAEPMAAGLPGLACACLAVVFAAAKAADAVQAVDGVGAGASVGAGTWTLLLAASVAVIGQILALVIRPR